MDEKIMEYEWKRQWEYSNPEPDVTFSLWDDSKLRTTNEEALRHIEWLDKRWADWKKEHL